MAFERMMSWVWKGSIKTPSPNVEFAITLPAPAAVPPSVLLGPKSTTPYPFLPAEWVVVRVVLDYAVAVGGEGAVAGRVYAVEVALDEVPGRPVDQEDVLVAAGRDQVPCVRGGPADPIAAGPIHENSLVVPLR